MDFLLSTSTNLELREMGALRRRQGSAAAVKVGKETRLTRLTVTVNH